jgi:hypothetical protein
MEEDEVSRTPHAQVVEETVSKGPIGVELALKQLTQYLHLV